MNKIKIPTIIKVKSELVAHKETINGSPIKINNSSKKASKNKISMHEATFF